MNDPRGILETFVRACDGYRGCRGQRFEDVSANLDPESRRMAYRQKHEEQGVCRSCKVKAKPGRKYCEKHLAEAAKRVKGARVALEARIDAMDRDLVIHRAAIECLIRGTWQDAAIEMQRLRTTSGPPGEPK